MQVQQLMSEPVLVCHTSDTLSDAARFMWENDVGAVPIVDNQGRVVSMLTDRDICMAAYTQGRPLSEIGVSVAMSERLVVCHPEDSLERAEELMSLYQVRRLPVVDLEGLVLGILSLNDLARSAAHVPAKHQGPPNGVRIIATTRTLAAVGANRLPMMGPKIA
ncbi:MAG: CBS domain-containing protein [Myxococcales bacterium]|nr:CBS domain-containing protein [Myxococcales bacterium]